MTEKIWACLGRALEEVNEMLAHNIPVLLKMEPVKLLLTRRIPNFLLEGDNLHSFKLLEKTHKGKIDVIYIDPPYNMGKKTFSIMTVSLKRRTFLHSKWLSLWKRLRIAKGY